MDGADKLAARAKSLIQRAFTSYNAQYGFSTTSCQVYDTAWVAMVAKTINGEKQWLFPECFHYLLKTQSDDGCWGIHPETQTAGILDTAAALLALLRHAAEPLQIQDVSPDELRRCIASASGSLRVQLAAWNDVSATNHIGVEMIVPSLLEYLEKEDRTLSFEYASKDVLASINAAKLSRFKPESLYSKVPSSAVHSLEAFVGKIDFDKVTHHLFQGSMMASPSSTAAYLINVSHWDEEAEAYLRHIVKIGAGHGDGGIPGTFPTIYFEYSWVLATLLRARFPKSDLECPELHGITSILVKAFQDEHGIIGFAPRAVDVDDTAKGLLALSMLGQTQHVSPDPMIKMFEGNDHFRTFSSERDPSFTSNCHVLLALLNQDDISRYWSQILKAVKFLCECWWNSDGRIRDKWNLSHLYPTMLMVEAFTDLLRLLDNGAISGLLATDLQWKVSISLFQACLRTLLEQREDGSWNGLPEQTSYAILTLAEARHVCFFTDIQSPLQSAIDRGMTFLKPCGFRSMDRNWTSKTAYRVTFVAEAYVLAASKVSPTPDAAAVVGSSLGLGISTAQMDGYMQLIRQTRLFSELPEWRVRASLLESALFVPLLRAQRLEVYARDSTLVGKDTYIDIIPFTWVGCNNRSCTFASTSFLYDMMILSLLGYQTDEFIEAVAAPAFAGNTAGLHELIDKIIAGAADSHTPANGVNGKSPLPEPREVSGPLSRFAAHVLGHGAVRAASPLDRENLWRELQAFLHAHATQVEDNAEFGRQTQQTDQLYSYTSSASSASSFFQWVRTTAADHVACAYSFSFACCLVSASLGAGAELFPTVTEKYLAAAAARHLATMCRMYNDFGSVARDTAEHNVNSVHFPEFAECSSGGTDAVVVEKQALAALAKYEHSCLDQALGRLEQEALVSRPGNAARDFGRRKMDIVRFYCDVTDFYDQLYVLGDLSSSIKRRGE